MFSLLRKGRREKSDLEKTRKAATEPPTGQAVAGSEGVPHIAGSSATTVLAHPVGKKLKSFFGEEVNLSSFERRDPVLKTSWRNVTISFGTFIVLLYCFAIQIWVIVRSFQASQSDSNANAEGSPSQYTTRSTSHLATMTRSISKVASATVNLRMTTSHMPKPTAKAVEYLWERSLKKSDPTEELSTLCLYLPGSEVSKHGAMAVVFNVLYNFWVAFFIILLLSYEHKRLRFSRKVHSAAVVGFIQAWMAVDHLAKGVEIWLVLASAGVFIASFFNLLYGLPKTHRHRRQLLPYLLSRPNDPSVPTAGKSYAVPSREGSFLPAAKDAVDALNRGIEEEQRQLKTSEAKILKMKIMEANMGPIDLVPYQTLPQTVLNPSLLKGLSEEEKKKHGIISKELEKSVIGGIMPFHSIGEQYNPMEMLRGMMRPSATGKAGAAGEDPTDKLIRWKMMNDLLKDAGGMDNRPQGRPAANMMGGMQPYAAAMPAPPAPVYAPHEANKMERYLQKQQNTMMAGPANAYSVYG